MPRFRSYRKQRTMTDDSGDDFHDFWIRAMLVGADRGNYNAARMILKHFVDATKEGESPDPRVSKYISDAFSQFLTAEVPIAKALSLSSKPGRRVGIQLEDLGSWIDIIGDMIKETDEGLSVDNAAEFVASNYSRSKSAVLKIYYEQAPHLIALYRQFANTVDDDRKLLLYNKLKKSFAATFFGLRLEDVEPPLKDMFS